MKTHFLFSRASSRGLALLAVLAILESCTGNNSPDVTGTNGKKKQESEPEKSSSSRQSIPTPRPYIPPTPTPVPKVQSTSPSSIPTATPIPTPTPITSIPPKPAPEAGNMEVNAILFLNMEHKKHAAEVGSYAILENQGKLYAYGPVLLSSASNGAAVTGAGGAYPVTKLKIALEYRNSEIPSQGQAQLSICKINSVPSPSLSSSQCVRSQAGGHERPVEWFQQQVPYTLTADTIKVTNQAHGNGNNVQFGLSFAHPVAAAAMGGDSNTFDDFSSPIVIDVNRDDKLDLAPVAGKKSVFFDVMNQGFTMATGWVKPTDGLLALDVNADGKINNGSELFGEASHSVKPIGKFELSPFLTGFDALAQYDENKDNVIDSKDKIYSKLLVWRDKNMNGTSEKKELVTVESLGITTLSLSKKLLGKEYNWPTVAGNELRVESEIVWKDGKKGKMVDVWFARGEKGLAKK